MKGSRSANRKIEIVDGPGVKTQLMEMFADNRTERICIASPYFKEYGADVILKSLEMSKSKGAIYPLKILISLEISDFVFGSSDITAVDRVLFLVQKFGHERIELRHLPNLHAKVYVNSERAVVGSANLTRPGLDKNGNLESAGVVSDKNNIALLQGQFDDLWNRGRVVTDELWKIRRKQILTLSHTYQKQIKSIHEEIRKECVALEKMPNEESQADYYHKLLTCLGWIYSDGSRKYKANRPLVKYLRDQSNRNSREEKQKSIGVDLAEKRIAFMKELGLIELRKKVWHVTPKGRQLDESEQSRKWLFRELLRWCENRGDEQFRILLQAIDNNTKKDTDEISLKNWFKSLPSADCQSWWQIPKKGETDYDKFCPKSCNARNWLVSLGVLHKTQRREDYYSRGDLYKCLSPRGAKKDSFDARLNSILAERSTL